MVSSMLMDIKRSIGISLSQAYYTDVRTRTLHTRTLSIWIHRLSASFRPTRNSLVQLLRTHRARLLHEQAHFDLINAIRSPRAKTMRNHIPCPTLIRLHIHLYKLCFLTNKSTSHMLRECGNASNKRTAYMHTTYIQHTYHVRCARAT